MTVNRQKFTLVANHLCVDYVKYSKNFNHLGEA